MANVCAFCGTPNSHLLDRKARFTYEISYGITFPGWPVPNITAPPIHAKFELKAHKVQSYPVSIGLSSY